MIKQAKILKSIGKNIVIKHPVPLKEQKLQKLFLKRYEINITLGFEPSQYLIFKDLNITYFSFIIGRVELWKK